MFQILMSQKKSPFSLTAETSQCVKQAKFVNQLAHAGVTIPIVLDQMFPWAMFAIVEVEQLLDYFSYSNFLLKMNTNDWQTSKK